jgi:acyl-CoA reductase-like NAD-dependent aldehyde dehydrogenase
MAETTDVDSLNIVHPDEFFIGGSWEKPTSDRRATVINPSTEETIAELADPGPGEVDRAVAAAREAFDQGPWGTLTVAERIVHVRRFTDALLARVPDIGAVWTAECGPTVAYRDAINGLVTPSLIEDSIGFAESVPTMEERTGFVGLTDIYREPYGVAVAIITYNGPLSYIAMKVLPALLAGNTVVLKTPPETRLVAQLIAQAAEVAELPRGVLSVLTAGSETSRYLVEHPGVDVVSFTGGTAVGSQILHSTADRIVKTTLELGGKSAGIIADDMELEALLPAVMPGLVTFQGQVCVALTRLLVSKNRHDEIVGALAGAFSTLRIGDAAAETTDFGPVAVSRTRDRCEQYVAGAVKEGATVAYGGKRPSGLDRGFFYEPTLLVGVENSMAVAQDEVFGPVFTVLTYEDIDDAVRIANDSPFGLTGAIFTHDSELALSVGKRLRVGSFTMNTVGGVPGQAFGGYKMSGIGREMGREGYLEWTQTKAIKLDSSINYLA